MNIYEARASDGIDYDVDADNSRDAAEKLDRLLKTLETPYSKAPVRVSGMVKLT